MSRALGRYELLRPLARGGMAEVYLARRRAAGVEKWLVVKRIRPERAGDARFLDLFVREARLSMSLAHQNIVPVFDFGRIDEQVFIAMERVEGKDLGSSLARLTAAGAAATPADATRAMSPLLAAFVAEECLQALDYAHRRRGDGGAPLGIVHRDVTPRNVLLSWSGEVKLTDFGIAALTGDQAERTMIGTPAYMAPEQARGEPLDARADLYAVGLILREMLSGARARPGDDREAVLAQARRGELVPWTGDAPDALRAIVERACALAPDDRFATATEMLAAVDAYIVGERAEKRGDAPARLLARWLEDVWQGEASSRDPGSSGTSDEIVADHLVSFMDDGELGVIGTGTVRSMALTATDGEDPNANPPGQSDRGTARSDAARRGDARQSAPRANEPALSTAPTQPTRWRAPALAIAAAVVVGGVWFVMRGGPSEGAHQPPVPQQPQPPSPQPQPPPSLQPTPQPTPTPTPQPVPTTQPQPPPTVEVHATHSLAHTPGMPVIHVAPPPAVTPPTGPRFRGTVNVKGSWAYFTIDDDPTQHATPDSNVELTAGPHHLHLWNPETKLERNAFIDVPAKAAWAWAEKLEP